MFLVPKSVVVQIFKRKKKSTTRTKEKCKK